MSCCSGLQECGVNKTLDTDPCKDITENVKDYYGKVLQGTADLKTNVCTLSSSRVPAHVRDIMKLLHKDVTSRYYGCGLIVPEAIEGCNVLDLGCGAGVDCYVLSHLVGSSGHVTGVDMTQEQLDVALKFIDYHMAKFGYDAPNVDFVNTYIEKLTTSGIQQNYYDVIVSNCVINLCVDKQAVLLEAYKVLKDGGEMYFSDMYCDRRLADETKKNKVLWGECIGGALYWKDLYSMARNAGFAMPRLVVANLVDITQPQLLSVIGDAKFMAATFRLFKLPASRDYTEPVRVAYNGTLSHNAEQYKFDSQYTFPMGVSLCVDGGVASILKHSRFADAFIFETDSSNTKNVVVNEASVPESLTWESMVSNSTSSKCC